MLDFKKLPGMGERAWLKIVSYLLRYMSDDMIFYLGATVIAMICILVVVL
jgi:hypothetical protein